MHIGLVIYGSLEFQSGGFLYDRQIVQQLEQDGNKVSVVALPWRGYFRSLLDNWDAALGECLAGGDWDVLLEDELAHPSLILPNRRVSGPPIISLVHLLHSSSLPWSGWRLWLYRLVERLYLRSLDGCIFVCRRNQELAQDLTGRIIPAVIAYPAGDHLPPVITTAEIKARAGHSSQLKVAYVGSLIPRKALHLLLAALEQSPLASWQLRVIGSPEIDPDYARRMQAQTQRPALQGHVQFLGALPNAQVAYKLAECDVLALHSESEGYAIAYLEAMAQGLPVIATTASGAGELIQSGQNGFLVAPGDLPAISQALQLLAEDAELRVKMSLAARATYESHPTWKDATQIIHTFLEDRIADHPGSSKS
jgi:glycosyltransferase involved in cell wall biosynthesis